MRKELLEKVYEYIKTAPRAVSNLDAISEGVVNAIKEFADAMPEGELKEINRRRDICMKCPFMSENAKTSKEYLELVGSNYQTSRQDLHCSLCGCNIHLKTASLGSSCGISTWNRDNPGRKMDLKWEAYDSGKKS